MSALNQALAHSWEFQCGLDSGPLQQLGVALCSLHRGFQVLGVPTSWPILSHHLLEGFRGFDEEIWSEILEKGDCRILFRI